MTLNNFSVFQKASEQEYNTAATAVMSSILACIARVQWTYASFQGHFADAKAENIQ